jgi:hypothetical protein
MANRGYWRIHNHRLGMRGAQAMRLILHHGELKVLGQKVALTILLEKSNGNADPQQQLGRTIHRSLLSNVKSGTVRFCVQLRKRAELLRGRGNGRALHPHC